MATRFSPDFSASFSCEGQDNTKAPQKVSCITVASLTCDDDNDKNHHHHPCVPECIVRSRREKSSPCPKHSMPVAVPAAMPWEAPPGLQGSLQSKSESGSWLDHDLGLIQREAASCMRGGSQPLAHWAPVCRGVESTLGQRISFLLLLQVRLLCFTQSTAGAGRWAGSERALLPIWGFFSGLQGRPVQKALRPRPSSACC